MVLNILDIINNNNEIYSSLVVAITISYILLLYKKLLNKEETSVSKKTIEAKTKFYRTLSNGLENGTIKTFEDINNIYEGIGGLIFDNPRHHRDNLNKWMKEYLVELISNGAEKLTDDINVLEWHRKISEFIVKIEEESPYSDLSDIERSILTDISTYLENGNNEDIKRKLSELSGVIQTRNNDFNKIQNINRWSVPLALIGTVLTLLFGLLSVIR